MDQGPVWGQWDPPQYMSDHMAASVGGMGWVGGGDGDTFTKFLVLMLTMLTIHLVRQMCG
jgi:hypothetical protein